ncbi:RNA polymerase sigma factor [Streptomyces hydrogenans]
MEREPNQRIRAGDRDAFAELFDGHARGVHAYAVRLTGDWALAEDIMSLTRQTVPGPPPATAAAVALLERAALAAASEPPEPARADQYVYVRVVGHTTVLSENADGGMDRTLQREDGESWTPWTVPARHSDARAGPENRSRKGSASEIPRIRAVRARGASPPRRTPSRRRCRAIPTPC